MSYNDRNNLAFADDGKIPQEDFLKMFAQACSIGWENMKQSAKNPCQGCGIESTHRHLILPEGKEIQLCDWHEMKFKKQFGL